MVPWNLEELKDCCSRVTGFQVIPVETMENLYSEIGGVPRYVLERPMEICYRQNPRRFPLRIAVHF